MDERITASMVFVSSFESKSGFAIETCAKRIAVLKFGAENVPIIVNPRDVVHNIDPKDVNGQIVVTDVDTHNGDLRGRIAAFRANNEAKGSGKTRVESGVTQESIRGELLPLADRFKLPEGQFEKKPVDLAFFDGESWNILELKAGGDLDSSNAPSNIEKLLTIYVDMGIENCKLILVRFIIKTAKAITGQEQLRSILITLQCFLLEVSSGIKSFLTA